MFLFKYWKIKTYKPRGNSGERTNYPYGLNSVVDIYILRIYIGMVSLAFLRALRKLTETLKWESWREKALKLPNEVYLDMSLL